MKKRNENEEERYDLNPEYYYRRLVLMDNYISYVISSISLIMPPDILENINALNKTYDHLLAKLDEEYENFES